jgi:hypothetical protein
MSRAAKVSRSGRAKEQRVIEAMLGLLRAGADIRGSKVRRVRRSVRSRTYENRLKLEVAIERLARAFR